MNINTNKKLSVHTQMISSNEPSIQPTERSVLKTDKPISEEKTFVVKSLLAKTDA